MHATALPTHAQLIVQTAVRHLQLRKLDIRERRPLIVAIDLPGRLKLGLLGSSILAQQHQEEPVAERQDMQHDQHEDDAVLPGPAVGRRCRNGLHAVWCRMLMQRILMEPQT